MFDENNTTNPSFFANMAMKFRTTESCDVNVDSVLADTVNDLFCNGLVYFMTIFDRARTSFVLSLA